MSPITLLDIRSWADFRAFLHVALPGLSVLLVALHYVTQGDATLWGALAAVLIQASLSTFNTANGFRKILYPLLAAGGALLIRYGLTTAETWGTWVGFLPILFGGGVAAANVDTTPATVTGKHALPE